MDIIIKTSNLIALLKHIKLKVYLHDGICSTAYQSDFVYNAYLLDDTACALIVSYTGESRVINRTISVLKEKKISIITLTSIGDNTSSLLSDCRLRVTTREKLYSKISSYSTDESVIYFLEILYSCLFKLNYKKNYERNIQTSELTESRETIINKIISEKKIANEHTSFKYWCVHKTIF